MQGLSRYRLALLALPFVCACTGSEATSQSSTDSTSTAAPLHLRDEKLQLVTSVRGLPLGVREELRTMFGTGGLDIAEPDGEFDVTAKNAKPGVPPRRLTAAGCANDGHCLVYYARGGEALTYRVALILWTPAATRFEWGGTAPAGLATIEDVRKAIVSGAIKGKQEGPW